MSAFLPRSFSSSTSTGSGFLASACMLGLFAVLSAGPAQAQAPFTSEAQARGISYFTPLSPGFGLGVGLVDLDSDGDPDAVLLGGGANLVGIYENDGTGNFTDRSFQTGLPNYDNFSSLMAFDYDADGDLDLYVSRYDDANLLLENLGNFAFQDVAAFAGVDDLGRGEGTTAGDMNGDGYLDFYLANYTIDNADERNLLYRNNGDGTFSEIGAALGMDDPAPSFYGVFMDADRDGDMDIYVSNDKGQSGCSWMNHLWVNDGNGVFLDQTMGTGLGVCIDSMGVTIGDINSDGFFDVYCANTPSGNPLLISDTTVSPTIWNEEAIMRGVFSNRTAWGVLFYDFDNDTDLDLWVNNQSSSDRMYVNDGNAFFTDQGIALGTADPNSSYCIATADIDGDNDLDVLVQNFNSLIDLYINQEGSNRRSARFRVRGRGNNTFAVGALLEARVGSDWQLRSVQAGANYKSQNEYVQHFGVDQALTLDELVVTWPNGSSRTLTDYPTNEEWLVVPLSQRGDADVDGQRDFSDFLVLRDCYAAGTVTPGCECMDYNGDATIDQEDFLNFFRQYNGPREDCNVNGVPDLLEILDQNSLDSDNNGELDSCQVPGGLIGDLTLDGIVNVNDLNLLLRSFGPCGGGACDADLDGNGRVDLDDMWLLLAFWG